MDSQPPWHLPLVVATKADKERWQQQLAQRVERTMARVYHSDPLLYAELLKIRRRLEPDAVLGTTEGTSRLAAGGGSRAASSAGGRFR